MTTAKDLWETIKVLGLSNDSLAIKAIESAIAATQPAESKACASVGEPTEPAFAPWFDANEHLLRDRGYTPRDYAMFAWHAALASPAQAPSTKGCV